MRAALGGRLSCCVMLGMKLTPLGPQFPHLQSGNNRGKRDHACKALGTVPGMPHTGSIHWFHAPPLAHFSPGRTRESGGGGGTRGCRAFPGPAHLLRALSLAGRVAWVLSVAGCPTGVLTPSCSVAVSLFSSRCRRPSPMWVLTREPGQEVRTSGIVCSSFLKGLPLGGMTQLRGT